MADHINKVEVQPMNLNQMEEIKSNGTSGADNKSVKDSVRESISSLVKGGASISEDSHGKSMQVHT